MILNSKAINNDGGFGGQIVNELLQNSKSKPMTRLYSPKKVVFAEPYEVLPDFLMKNDLKRGDCSSCFNKNSKDKGNNSNQKFFPSFNLPFLPFLSSLLSGGGGIGNIVTSILSGNSGETNSQITNILSNPEILASIGKIFFKNSDHKKKHSAKSDDFNLEDYTRVE